MESKKKTWLYQNLDLPTLEDSNDIKFIQDKWDNFKGVEHFPLSDESKINLFRDLLLNDEKEYNNLVEDGLFTIIFNTPTFRDPLDEAYDQGFENNVEHYFEEKYYNEYIEEKGFDFIFNTYIIPNINNLFYTSEDNEDIKKGVLFPININFLSTEDLMKWADSYGFQAEKKNINNIRNILLDEGIHGVLIEIILEKYIDREIIERFVIDKQIQLLESFAELNEYLQYTLDYLKN